MGLGGEAAVHLREGAVALARAVRFQVFSPGDGEVAQARHDVRGAGLDDLMAVFVIGAVAPVMQRVLDGPVRAQRRAGQHGVEPVAPARAT